MRRMQLSPSGEIGGDKGRERACERVTDLIAGRSSCRPGATMLWEPATLSFRFRDSSFLCWSAIRPSEQRAEIELVNDECLGFDVWQSGHATHVVTCRGHTQVSAAGKTRRAAKVSTAIRYRLGTRLTLIWLLSLMTACQSLTQHIGGAGKEDMS
jgi:hypothetical protein